LINSWSSYKNWIESTIKGGAQYYYRGQRQTSWKLQTSFHRYSEKTGISMLDYLDRIIPEVNYYVGATENKPIDISNKIEFGSLLARLQHHGFPTPLLDWTFSPYIAAYFAFKDIDPHKPDARSITIHMFDFNLWAKSFQQPLNLRDSVSFVSAFRPHAKNNPRMIQQMAVTTATNISDMGQYLISRGNDSGNTFLYSATLPTSERKLVMNELNLMGINSMTMFPDFDGICASMKETYFHNIDVKPFLVPPPPPLPPLPPLPNV